MLEELGVDTKYGNTRDTFVKVTLVPPHNSLKFPVESWRLEIDQNFLPDWWDDATYEPRIKETVEKWYKKYVIFEGKHYLTGGPYYIFDHANVTGNECVIHAFDNSRITVNEGKVFAYDQASVTAEYDCEVIAYDRSEAIILNNSHGFAYNRAKIMTKNKASAILRHESTGESYGCSSMELFNDSKAICHDTSICFGHQGKSIECYNESVAHIYNTESVKGHDNSVLFIHNGIESTSLTISDNAITRNIKK